MFLAGFTAADVFAGLIEGVRGLWSFLNSDQGLMVEGFFLALAGLYQLHRVAAADLLRTHGKKKLVDILAKVEAKLKAMQGERDEARAELGLVMATLEAARPDHEVLNDLRARLTRMEAVWLDSKAHEGDCRSVLEANQWVLLPDYVVDPKGLLREVSLATVLDSDFPHSADRSMDFRTPINPGWTADLAGWASAESGLDIDRAATDSDGGNARRLYLIIALRGPGEIIDRVEIEHAHAYAHSLMLMTPDTLWGQRIDCLVIGGAVASDLNGADLRWGPTAHAAIRIIPVTYRQLLARARRVAATFLPALPDSALDAPSTPAERSIAEISALPAEATVPAIEAPVLETAGLELTEPANAVPVPVAEPHVDQLPSDRPDLHEAQRRLRGLLDRFHGREPR